MVRGRLNQVLLPVFIGEVGDVLEPAAVDEGDVVKKGRVVIGVSGRPLCQSRDRCLCLSWGEGRGRRGE